MKLAQSQGLFEQPFILCCTQQEQVEHLSLTLSLSLSKDLLLVWSATSLSLRYLELIKSAFPTLTAAEVIYLS
eukprot:scaffold4478_cov107-Skeletonema_dohrnii-CCMP3373.AAC.4